jgi:hypothetical protein
MSRARRPGAKYGSPEWRARVSAGLRRRYAQDREAKRVRPADLEQLRERNAGTRPELLPFLEAGACECAAVLEALGGGVTPQRRILAEDLGRLGALLRAVVALFAQTGAPELASRAASLATSRRSILATLGLERCEKTLDLGTYLEQRAAENDVEAPAAHEASAESDRGSDAPPSALDPRHVPLDSEPEDAP